MIINDNITNNIYFMKYYKKSLNKNHFLKITNYNF